MSVESIILALIALVVLGIVVMLLYLLDRVDTLEKRQTPDAGAELQRALLAGGFGTLSGRKLWDAACGAGNSNLTPDVLAALRENLRPVLVKHVQEVFNQGANDARNNLNQPPKPDRTVTTLRAKVESHLPPPQVSALYRCGQEYAAATPDTLPRLRQNLEQIGGAIQGKIQIALAEPFASLVLSPTELEATQALTAPAESGKDAAQPQQESSAEASIPPPAA
jgi:hypothetical protein